MISVNVGETGVNNLGPVNWSGVGGDCRYAGAAPRRVADEWTDQREDIRWVAHRLLIDPRRGPSARMAAFAIVRVATGKAE